MNRPDIFLAIQKERFRQDTMHPAWKGNYHGVAVLTEEVGEVAKAAYELENQVVGDSSDKNLREELIQVAAVAIRWLENMD